jgi:hypothetical protein
MPAMTAPQHRDQPCTGECACETGSARRDEQLPPSAPRWMTHPDDDADRGSLLELFVFFVALAGAAAYMLFAGVVFTANVCGARWSDSFLPVVIVAGLFVFALCVALSVVVAVRGAPEFGDDTGGQQVG